jgi:iron complex transport system substrate-binding protein
VFPAGPPAAILLYTLAPDLLLGWPRANRPEECVYMLPDICARPEVGRITGRGNTANLEVVLALKPDLILDIGSVNPTFVSLAARVQEQTGIPYALLDGRFDAIAPTYRKLGELTHRQAAAEALARYADETMTTIKARVEKIPRPAPACLLRARAAWAGDRLGGSINVETIDFLGAHNVAAERKGGLAIVSVEQVLLWNPMSSSPSTAILPRACGRSGVGVGRGGARRTGASFAENAVRLGRFPAVGQPADRAVVARQDPLSRAIPEDIGALTRDFYRRFYHVTPTTRRSSMCWRAGTDTLRRCPAPPPGPADRLRRPGRRAAVGIHGGALSRRSWRSAQRRRGKAHRPGSRRPGCGGERDLAGARAARAGRGAGRRGAGGRRHCLPGLVPQSAGVA